MTKKFRILSIDGGGVRGIIPAYILSEIETLTGKPICELFDLIVGTSTGALIALGLTCPASSSSEGLKKPKFSAADLIKFYKRHSDRIFQKSLARDVRTGYGLWKTRYDRKYYDVLLERIFTDAFISESIRPVIIPAYELCSNSPVVYNSNHCYFDDYRMCDIASAASSAPTYFPPKKFKPISNVVKLRKEGFPIDGTEMCIDGAIWANNPETLGVEKALEMNPDLKKEDIYVLSVGTGKVVTPLDYKKLLNGGIIQWAPFIIDIMMDAQSESCDNEIRALYKDSDRLEVDIPEHCSKMDDGSEKNIQALCKISESYIVENKELFESIVKKILSPI